MRGLCLGIALAGVLLAARPSEGAESLAACDPARTKLDKLICAHPDLRQSGSQIAEQVEQLRSRYQGEDLRVFNVEYKRWRYDLNICPGGDPWNKRGSYGCVRDEFDARLRLLADLGAGRKGIQEVAASYRRAKPWYVNALPRQYEGRAVQIDAYVYLRGCNKPGTSHSALLGFPRWALRGRPQPFSEKNASIEMRFDRINDNVKGRICDKGSADLTGTVMLDHGRPYIYVPELF